MVHVTNHKTDGGECQASDVAPREKNFLLQVTFIGGLMHHSVLRSLPHTPNHYQTGVALKVVWMMCCMTTGSISTSSQMVTTTDMTVSLPG